MIIYYLVVDIVALTYSIQSLFLYCGMIVQCIMSFSQGVIVYIIRHDITCCIMDISVIGCDNKPCMNGGTCTEQNNTVVCVCVDGYAGSDCRTSKYAISSTF